MPLTFAHPAILLPFSRKSTYVHFSAMVLGSMSPDFEYFVRGRPVAEIGHSFTGFFVFNLPLVAVFYLIYHYFVHKTFMSHLPHYLQDTYTHRAAANPVIRVFVFLYSALFGMLTHVAWDAFTHKQGVMVTKFPGFFNHMFSVYGHSIPLYKFLQHGSTLLGLSLIFIYLVYRSRSNMQEPSSISVKQKAIFWAAVCLLAIVILLVWYVIAPVSLQSYGVHVVRIVDAACLGLLGICLFQKLRPAQPQ
ncbi:DUF4184 family protein [Paenibacillus camerounensis]|uniref:DUF4184 family protein n=1 Tax=Paenibacillus camerounensis TaxID=1243663 RepID=UPI0005AB8280|nr:DUF4184 family protein [Paenibacillus camerounensis]